MRKIYFTMLLALFISCVKNEPLVVTEQPLLTLTADEYRAFIATKGNHTISYEEAMQQAIEASSLFSDNNQTKAAPKQIIDGFAITTKLSESTKSNTIEVDTLIYLFNYADNGGYVFVSADERAPGILSYIENGYFNRKDSIECPGAVMLFSGMEVLVRQEIERSEFLKDSLGAIAAAKYDAITQNSNLLTRGPIGPGGGNNQPIGPSSFETVYTKHNPNYGTIIQTNWGQGDPFNNLLPPTGGLDHAYVGCTAVAVAQIMAHFNYPQSYKGIPIYTSEIRQYKNADDFSTFLLKEKVAIFNKFIFDNIIFKYDENGSSSDYPHARDFLRAMGYTTPWSSDKYNFGDVKSSIDSGWLVYIDGYSHRTNEFLGIVYAHSGGHSWIIDHYTNITKTIYEVKTYSNKVTKTAISSETKMYNHCNMGWEEVNNGYYIEGVFNASVSPEVKTKSDIKHNYKYKIEIAPGIR